MIRRIFSLIALLSMLLSVPASVLAQEPLPLLPTPFPPPAQPTPSANPLTPSQRVPLSTEALPGMTAQALTVGQPGLSFRFTRTLGQTGQGYVEDTAHLNYPWGLDVDNAGNVWISELWGNRAMKYDSAGTFQQKIGNAGSGYLTNTIALWEIADVGADGNGNVWVVDDGASHITKFDSSGNFVKELGVPWSGGSDNTHFATPVSIAFDATGNIYVSDGAPWWSSDTGNHRIQVFNPSGTRIATIGTTGMSGTTSTLLHGPQHIAIDRDHNRLYIADAGNQRVQIFNIATPSAPKYVKTLGTTAVKGTDNRHFNQPSGVAVDSDYIYVADTMNHRVQVFNRTTYAYVATLGVSGEAGNGNDHFNEPVDVAVDGGNVYIADFVNTRVQEFTHSGAVFTYARTLGTAGVPYLTDGAHYNHPSGVAVDADGNILITEDSGQRLVKLSAAGSKLWSVGVEGVKGDWDYSNGRLNNPADVAVDASGKSYVADRWHNRVQIYNPNGTYYRSITGLSCPGGVHIAPNGYLYIANTCNQTVKIYNASLGLVATMGIAGAAGSDNAHFNAPEDVAVDGNGLIYVSDQNNQRVQVFNASRAYVRTLGVTGSCGVDFSRFCAPEGLAIDGANRVYVADAGNNRVQVFSSTGAYLTTLAGLWGTGTDQMRASGGIAVDTAGNVFVADRNNHRIQEFARRVPGWSQMNINGFGTRGNADISAIAPFSGMLYAGVSNSSGAQIWRSNDGLNWSAAMTGGFGDPRNVGIDHLMEFNGQLYAGLWSCANTACTVSTGGQIWRSSDGLTWEQVASGGFDSTSNGEVYRLASFNGAIFAATWTWDSSTNGGEVWSSATGDANPPSPAPKSWKKVVPNGFGDINNWATTSFEVFNGFLYAGTYNSVTGGEVWRCSICSGASTDWAPVSLDGFGDAGNRSISSLATVGSWLYASTMNTAGVEIWRCTTCDGSDWAQVSTNGFGNSAANGDAGLQVFNAKLYVVVDNASTGAEVWNCTLCGGTDWAPVGLTGFGDENNGVHADKTALFNNRLYIGTYNYGNGGEIWSPPALAYPVVESIKLLNPSPTNSPSVSFIVGFSENVTGVDVGDFTLATSSQLTGASITSLNGSGDTYIVTVARGTGNGTLRLDLIDDDSIVDQVTGTQPLGGTGMDNGSYTTGAYYVIPVSMTFRSFAAPDGWVLESGENSNLGGSMSPSTTTFILGDDSTNRQYRSILSFGTADLPDTAVVTGVTLKIKKAGATGSNPFATLGNILVDFRNGNFGTAALQLTDFQAAASSAGAMTIKNNPQAGGWYYATIGGAADALVNKLNNTQIRLRFKKDDNNNRIADTLSFYSGNFGTLASRPMLIVQYYVP